MQPTAAARPRLIWGCDASGVVDRDATCIVDRPGRRTTMTRGPGFPGPNAATAAARPRLIWGSRSVHSSSSYLIRESG